MIRTRDLTLTKGALYRWSYGSITIDALDLHEIMTPLQVGFWPVASPSVALQSTCQSYQVGRACNLSQLQQPAHDGAGAPAEKGSGEELSGGAFAGVTKGGVGRDHAAVSYTHLTLPTILLV